MTAPELIQRIEAAGGVLTLRGDRIQYELPKGVALLLEPLQKNRDEVLRLLQQRERRDRTYEEAVQKTIQSIPQNLPPGVRLLAWAPKLPPVAIETWAVVTDVPGFVRATFQQLQAALAGKNWLAGNRSVRELVDRLQQVGVEVEVTTAGHDTRTRG